MSVILLAYLPGILGICAVAYLVFTRRQNNLAYTAFCWSLILIASWLLFQMMSLLVPNSIAALMVNISLIFTNLMVAFFMVFAVTYQAPPTRDKYMKTLLVTIFLPAVAISFFSLTPLVVESVVNDGLKQEIYFGPLYVVQTLYIVSYILVSLVFLGGRMSNLKGKSRNAQILLMTGFAVPVVINLAANYVFGLPQDLLQYLLPMSMFITVAIVGYAIAKHGLFDVRLAAVRTVAYGLSILALATIYYAVAYLVSVTIFKGKVSSAFSMSPLNILLAIILAFIFQPIKNFFDRVTDKIFYRDRYNSDEFYTRLSEVLTTTTDLRGLLQRAAREIGETLKAEQAFFFVQYNHVHHVTAGTPRYTGLPVRDAEYLDEYVMAQGSDVIVAEMIQVTNRHIYRLMVSHKLAIVMPLMRQGDIIGYLALGEQLGSGYTNRDVKVLKTVSDELVIAIQNALSVQEVKDTNANLEQRINTATAELRRSNARLKRLDAAKDEFLSMASHQLRTPLTSVKGYLSMILDGDVGKITPMQRRVLEEAFSSSERMVHLIHDFLNVSRLQTGKFVLELQESDLTELVRQEVKSLQRVAESRDMKLEFTDKAGPLPMEIDDTKLRQVVMNYIDNAIFYSHPGTTIKVGLSIVSKRVALKVEDTGIGVPKREQERLFTKFYRATNARRQRPDGTGVGLFLAQKVISAHGGEVLFESKEGRGSIFGFKLPLALPESRD